MYTFVRSFLLLLPLFNSSFSQGIFTAYWVDYGVANGIGPVTRQWQIPIALQIVPAVLLGIGMLTVTESVRWLAQKGRDDEAWESLKWIRADDSEETRAELKEIQASIAEDQAARSGFQYAELLERDNFKRLSIGVIVFLCQQSVGATALVGLFLGQCTHRLTSSASSLRRPIMARASSSYSSGSGVPTSS
jgi:hypothetical protein